MSILVFGVNYKTAPVALRERIAYAPDQLPQTLTAFVQTAGVREAVILSTCNRTEFYCRHDQTTENDLSRWLTQQHGFSEADLAPYLYAFPQEEAVRHLLRVACGLDSMVLGEPQILGQVKQAYELALRTGTLGKLLNKMFQHAFSVAKQVRTDTAIGNSPVSVAFAAVRLAQQVFGDLKQRTALFIGAGDTIELAGQHLLNHGLRRLIIANRSVERAELLAERFGGYAIPLRHLDQHVAEADIIISATASPEPVLTRDTVAHALKSRRQRPVFIADIAVPRDVEASVSDLDNVYLYTVDDLQTIIQENLQSRHLAAQQANDIIATEVKHFMVWLQSLDAVSAITAVRERTEQARLEVLLKARRRLARGENPETVLEFLADGLTAKFLHGPSVKLREASAAGRDELIRTTCELFDISWPPAKQEPD